ncbi:MAG: glycosyltransferase family 39 protein [Sulfurimonadaceae bacterium]
MGNREKLFLLVYTFFNAIANQFIKLYADETYYWVWSQKLSLSYFDHPPMVAYMIKMTTLFSDEPFFVRLPAVLLVSATAYILYKLARKMFDERTAIYTFYIFLSSVFVLVASTVIAPDIPLMFFWALTLYSGYMYVEEDNKKYALLTGLSAGAMLLSKYTGVLPLFTLVVFVLIYRRDLLKDIYFYLALLIAALVFIPVLYWNYQHDFISFAFQFSHGISEEKVFQGKYFYGFIGSQFALFHPLYLLPLFYFIIRDKERFERKKVYLLLPFLFVVGFFTYNSVYTEANPQWAAGAYLSATVLLGYYFAQYNMRKLMASALTISLVVLVALKTPLSDYIPPLKRFHDKLGIVDNFDAEIKDLQLDIAAYDYLLIDNYHGSDVAYYLRKSDNLLLLSSARFSQYNIWRHDELGITLDTEITTIPKLGKVLYISKNPGYVADIRKLFVTYKELGHYKKKVGRKEYEYIVAELEN